MENPYESSPSEASFNSQSTFGLGYWAALVTLSLFSFLLLPIVFPLGMLCLGANFFAILRTLAFVSLLRSPDVAEPESIYPVLFLMSSLGIGLAATAASCVAFVAICFPVAATIFATGTSPLPDWLSFSIVVASIIIAIVAGIWVGWLVVKLSLPKRTQVDGLTQPAETLDDPRL